MPSKARLVAVLLALQPIAAAAPAPAQSNAENLLAVCGDVSRSAETAARFCANALRAGGLSPGQRAAAALNLGGALLELERPEEAERAYDAALGARPGWALALAGRAGARDALGRPREAARDWDEAVGAAPRDPSIRGGRAAFRLRRGDAAGALDDLDSALERAPRDATLRFNRALALAALGREADAEAAFSALIAETPGDAGLWLERGRVRQARDPSGALADFDAAAARDREWAEPWMARGALLDRLGRVAEADDSYRRAWELGRRDEALEARIRRMGG